MESYKVLEFYSFNGNPLPSSKFYVLFYENFIGSGVNSIKISKICACRLIWNESEMLWAKHPKKQNKEQHLVGRDSWMLSIFFYAAGVERF